MSVFNAIPTVYAGVRFRSRLEAKWAAFFDLADWRWEYEPIDLHGYIPDFLVWFGCVSIKSGEPIPTLVEVKPALAYADLSPAMAKVNRSGWDGDSYLLGASLDVVAQRLPSGIWQEQGLGLRGDEDGDRSALAWRKAGNLTQWKPPRGGR